MIKEESLIIILDMKVGDKVKVKSLDEIRETLDENNECKSIFFVDPMYKYSGKTLTISKVNKYGCCVRENTYLWAYDWVIPNDSSPYFNDGSKEQKSLCLALIRQAMSGNPVNLKIFTDLKEGSATFLVESHRGFNYIDFLEDRWSGFVANNIPDWPCLNLKPEILEKAIINCLGQHNLEYLKQVLHKTPDFWFLFSKTEDSDYWFAVTNKLRNLTQDSIESTYEQPLKIQNNETELQRKKASVIRGDLPEGSEQRSGKSKASVVCGHLCYNICSGGQET